MTLSRTILAALIASTISLPGCGAQVDCSTFDAGEWRAAKPVLPEDRGSETRRRLAKVLAKCDILQGKTRAEVNALLGAELDAGGQTDRQSAVWEVAPLPYSDSRLLLVELDRDGRVTEVRLTTG